MKYKCPKREIREASWTRLPTPNPLRTFALKAKLEAHDSNGHYWYNSISTHWWIEIEEDYIWIMMTL